jgi:hypothetical protein
MKNGREEVADAIVLFFQELPCSRPERVLPLERVHVVRGSLELWADEKRLIPDLDWRYCKRGVELLSQQRFDHLVVRYLAAEGALFELPLELLSPPLRVRAELVANDGGAQAIPVIWKQGALLFRREDLMSRGRLRVFYDESVLDSHELRLPHVADVGSVVLYPKQPCRREDYVLEQRYLTSRCEETETSLRLRYNISQRDEVPSLSLDDFRD